MNLIFLSIALVLTMLNTLLLLAVFEQLREANRKIEKTTIRFVPGKN